VIAIAAAVPLIMTAFITQSASRVNAAALVADPVIQIGLDHPVRDLYRYLTNW
jgi:hypothetical protein